MSTLKLKYEDRTYTLEYTLASLRAMDRGGFSLSKVTEQPSTMLPLLFRGAFLEHHAGMKEGRVNEIYDHLENRSGLIEKLIDLYSDALNSLMEDNEEALSEKKASWEEG